ncbi:hypothetical protein ACIGCZ_29105 [Streptomyces nigra]|uniref:hypothetical protein n=1 Tax=Streptomyces nigra TaxID=1827580 RepID=UPI0037D2766A
MARLWTCGFELQSATAGVEFSVVNGAPTISTTVHRAGAAALRSNPTAGTQYAEHQLDAGTVKRTLHRFYLRIATLPSADCNIYGIGQSGYFPGLLRLTTTGTLTLRDGFTSANLGSPSAPLVTGRWYRIELDYTDTAGTAGSVTGAFKGYLDGTLFADTLCSNINGWSRIRAGVQSAATADIYIDDIAVNDTTGSVQNGLPGPGSVVHLRPDSAGDAAGWTTTVGGTSNWQRVSETTPDDATTYNATTATGTTAADDFNLGSSAAAGIGANDSITLVQVGGRIGSDAATTASLVYRIKGQSGGTVTESASVSVALTGWATHKAAAPYPYQLTSYTNPQTGAAWTPAALDTAQIGYRANVSQTTTRRVSTLWALVEFQPVTAGALGTASETDTAQALTALAGVPIGTLTDDFADGTVDPAKWPDSYEGGGFSEVGGRARVACNTAYNAFASAEAYRLRESGVHVRVWPPTAGGAVAEAWTQLLIQTQTLGTDAIFEVSAVTGNLIMASRVGYFDAAQVAIPYDPDAHAWLRIRETGGQLFWDTSPDGLTWTNRRTATSPAWVGDTTLQVQLIAHRDGGVDDYAEFDSFNVTPGSGIEEALDPASETSAAQALAWVKRQALGTATETAAAQVPGRARARALTAASATVSGQPLAPVKRRTLALSAAADSAQLLAPAKRAALTAAETTATARALSSERTLSLDSAAQSTAGRALTGRKTLALPAVAEADAAQAVTGGKRAQLGTASEVAAAQPGAGRKTRAAEAAAEASAAQTLASASGLQPTEETSTAHPLGGAKTRALGVAGEEGEAQPVGRAKVVSLGGVAETATAQPLTSGRSRALAPAEETWTALLLGMAKARQLPSTTATEDALPLAAVSAGQLPAATETSTAQPVTSRKSSTVSTAATAEGAQLLPGRKTSPLGTAVEASAGRSLSMAKHGTLSPASETAEAQRLLIPGNASPAEETATARVLVRAKAAALAVADVADEALPLGAQTAVQLGRAIEDGGAVPARRRKAQALTVAGASTTAEALAGGKTLSLGTAWATDRALIGPKIRLTQAIDRGEALALTGRRQRPADWLTPSTSGPNLTPSTSGPTLTPSTSGPRLAASSTSGG